MRKLTSLFVYIALTISTIFPISASASVLNTQSGGTGTSTPSGILYGQNTVGSPLLTVGIGSNLTFSGGILSAAGGGSSGWSTTSQNYYNSQFRDFSIVNGYLTSTTSKGLILTASSTIGNGTATGGLTISGNGTTTATMYANNFVDLSTGGNTCIGETGTLLDNSHCVSSIASSGNTLTVSSPTGNVNVDLNLTTGNIWSNASTTFAGGLTSWTATTTSATTTNFAVTGVKNAILSTNGIGNVTASTSIGSNYISGNLFTVTTAAPLGGAASISQGNTLALTCTGCLTANQSITLSGVVTGTGSTAITTAFGNATQGVLSNITSTTGVPQFNATSSLYVGATGQIGYFSGSGALTGNPYIYSVTGNTGISTTSPFTTLSVGGSAYIGGNLTATGTSIFKGITFTSATGTQATTTSFYNSGIGINSSGVIYEGEALPATSTTINLNWATAGQKIDYQIGTSAVTITVTNATTSLFAGSQKTVEVCNPGTTAGALTWVGVEWAGTAPTQTTTAGQCDFWWLYVTKATSTSAYKVAGGAQTGFQ